MSNIIGELQVDAMTDFFEGNDPYHEGTGLSGSGFGRMVSFGGDVTQKKE